MTSLTITGDSKLTAIGQHATLTAVANKSDFTTMVVTASVTWQSSNTAVLTVAGNSVTAIAAGSAVVTGTYQGFVATLAISVMPQADCFTYDASIWQIAEVTGGFQLNGALSGIAAPIFRFDTQTDASNGLAVFQRFSTYCFVGRDNARSNRTAYIFPYWLDATGRSTTVQPEDCEPYAPSTLNVASAGSSGWSLAAGGRQLMLLDTAADANEMLAVAQKYSNQCFIGRGNTRSTPSAYTLPYWK